MTHDLRGVVKLFAAQPWAIEASTFTALATVFARKYRGESFSGAQLHAELGDNALSAAARGRKASTAPQLAVIPIMGIISQRASSLGESVDAIEAKLEAAVTNPAVDGIMLFVDSPGGTVAGIPELVAKIREARSMKPMLTVTDGLMASASYWLGAATGYVMATPSAQTGSIGAYMVHEDWTKHLEQEGVKMTAISAGKFKLEGAPWAPLDDEAKSAFQERVDEVYGWFVKDVAADRGASQQAVRDGYGEGRVLGAKQSLDANLIDAVGTFDDAAAKLTRKVELTRERAASVDREVQVRTRTRARSAS